LHDAKAAEGTLQNAATTSGPQNGEAFGVRLSFLALWIGDNFVRGKSQHPNEKAAEGTAALHDAGARSAHVEMTKLFPSAPALDFQRQQAASMPVAVAIIGMVLTMTIMVVCIISIITAVMAFMMMMVPVPVATGHCQKCHCTN